jgi:hypothetical protein
VSLRAALLHELGLAEKVLADPAAVQHLRESLELASDPVQRAAVAPDLAELLVLTGQWDAGAAFIQAALEELADRDVQQGERARSAVVRPGRLPAAGRGAGTDRSRGLTSSHGRRRSPISCLPARGRGARWPRLRSLPVCAPP